jgi:cytochrome b subunit of formate dehydrogenase
MTRLDLHAGTFSARPWLQEIDVTFFIYVIVPFGAASICVHNLWIAWVHDYVRGSKAYGHRYIYGAVEPGKFWAHVSSYIFCIVSGLVVGTWNLISPETFAHWVR